MSLRALLILLVALAATGCSPPPIAGVSIGDTFPTVTGESLDRDAITFPDEVRGGGAILIVGYVQDAQFDIDRWLLGLTQLSTPVPIYEVPTIDGMVPGMFAGFIDNGMRAGIPSADWSAVVTLYGDDAEKVADWTGKERPRNGRVFLLDDTGRVIWFADDGYSAGLVTELDNLARGVGRPE